MFLFRLSKCADIIYWVFVVVGLNVIQMIHVSFFLLKRHKMWEDVVRFFFQRSCKKCLLSLWIQVKSNLNQKLKVVTHYHQHFFTKLGYVSVPLALFEISLTPSIRDFQNFIKEIKQIILNIFYQLIIIHISTALQNSYWNKNLINRWFW